MKKILAVLMLALATLASTSGVLAQAPAKPDIIEVIEITGEITAGTASMVAAAVEKINETQKIKGVLLVVNSPGGGASASAVVYQELSRIKVPVVGYCEYLCASGGAYALMSPSVKYIGVRDDSIGGSIGVVAQLTRFNRLLNWAKIDSETFKSGALKDAGNPTREMIPEDRKYIQGIVDELAIKFYHVVGKARPKLTPTQWADIKSAKIFIGPHVVAAGLADAVMSRDEAIAKVKELAKSKNAYTRDELRKITKDSTEAANMRPVIPTDFIGRGMAHLDTAMAIVAEVRSGEAVRFEYRMPYQF